MVEIDSDVQLSIFRKVINILEELEIPYFVGGGTLLGAIRDGDFISSDYDFDIDIPYECYRKNYSRIRCEFTKNNFQLLRQRRFPDSKAVFEYDGIIIEIIPYRKLGAFRSRMMSRYPSSLIENSSKANIRGVYFQTYVDTKRYLHWFYGDWRQPKKGSISSYVTKKSRATRVNQLQLRLLGFLEMLNDSLF